MNKHDDMSRIRKHMPDGEDITLIILKAHLLVEELLDEIIGEYCRNKQALKNVQISFSVKLKLAEALSGRDDLSHGWKMVEKLNSLRNALAHSLEHPLEKRRLDGFLSLYYEHPGKTSKISTSEDLRSAIYLLFVYILGARSTSRDQGSEMSNV